MGWDLRRPNFRDALLYTARYWIDGGSLEKFNEVVEAGRRKDRWY